IAAVRALSVVTSTLATWARSGRTRNISAPPASTAEITGETPRRAASSPAASAAKRALVSQRRHLGHREVGRGGGDRDRLVLVGRLAAGADRADDLAVDGEGDAAGQAGCAVQGERADPAGR